MPLFVTMPYIVTDHFRHDAMHHDNFRQWGRSAKLHAHFRHNAAFCVIDHFRHIAAFRQKQLCAATPSLMCNHKRATLFSKNAAYFEHKQQATLRCVCFTLLAA